MEPETGDAATEIDEGYAEAADEILSGPERPRRGAQKRRRSFERGIRRMLVKLGPGVIRIEGEDHGC
jgi:hypothetical protein